MMLDGVKNIQSVKLVWSIALKTHALPSLKGNNKGLKTNRHIIKAVKKCVNY